MSGESVTSISGRATSAEAGNVSGGRRPGTSGKRSGPVLLAVRRARRDARPVGRDLVLWALAERIARVADSENGREAVAAGDRLEKLLAKLGGGEHDPGPGTSGDDPYGGSPTVGHPTHT